MTRVTYALGISFNGKSTFSVPMAALGNPENSADGRTNCTCSVRVIEMVPSELMTSAGRGGRH